MGSVAVGREGQQSPAAPLPPCSARHTLRGRMEPSPGDLDWETPTTKERGGQSQLCWAALLPGPGGVGGGGTPRSWGERWPVQGGRSRGWGGGGVLLIISSPCSPTAPAPASLAARQFPALSSQAPSPRQAVHPHPHPTPLGLGGLEQARQFYHLAPGPDPRYLRTPSISRPFPAPLASPSSSVLCLSVSLCPSLSPPSLLLLPPACLPPLLPPTSLLSFLPSLLSSWWAPRWRCLLLLCPPTWASCWGASGPGLSGMPPGAGRGGVTTEMPSPSSLCPLLPFCSSPLFSIPQAAKEAAWTWASGPKRLEPPTFTPLKG